ncbi:MAG TPA: 4Fe-4S dicluster domain-containing protein [Syntrophorhabdaceae bacterium]|jgi:molybdopterin-containing oxidoreductase family iron-sulfur binding subunit
MASYIMVIKTNMCTGCQTCSVACKMENLTMPGCDRTVIRERVDATWEVGMCMQCENPPCVPPCPVQATFKNDKGIIVVDQDKCIGCGRCIEACPYGARHMNPEKGYFTPPLPYEGAAAKARETHRRHVSGKVDKCDWCLHRVSAKKPPMCVEACTTLARVFGDSDDPKSEVARLLKTGAKPLKPELGTKPKVYYV